MRCDICQNSFIKSCYSKLHLFHFVVQLCNAYLQLWRITFAPHGSSNRRSLSSSNQSAHPPSKRKKHNAIPKSKFKVCETCTHTFFCLAIAMNLLFISISCLQPFCDSAWQDIKLSFLLC